MTMYRREYTHTRRLLSLVLMLGCLISSVAISHRSANARIETSNNSLPGEQPASEKINLSQRALYPPMGADSLVSSTYWGQGTGYGNSEGRAIALDSENHVLVAGVTTAQ